MPPLDDITEDDLDGKDVQRFNADGTVLKISIRRTGDAEYPSGWRYSLHYGFQADEDTSILRYDNSHERENGHERHSIEEDEPELSTSPAWSTRTDGSSKSTTNSVGNSPAAASGGAILDTTGNMSTKTLRIRIEAEESFSDDILTSRATDDEKIVSFEDIKTFSRVLSAKKLELLRAIATHEPGSMRQAAELVDRDVKNVHEDLETLEEMRLVSFEPGKGRANRPVVPYNDIKIDIPLQDKQDTEQPASV